MKLVKRILFGILLFGVLYSIFVFSLIIKGTKKIPEKDADTLLILGAQVKGDPAYPSPVLKERLDTAVTYLAANPKTIAIVCGGKGKDEKDSEANVMAEYLEQRGISKKRIIKEEQSTSTKENLKNAQALRKLNKTVIVSSDFHIYRAERLARQLGITDISALPAKSTTSAKYKTYAREILALGHSLIFDH